MREGERHTIIEKGRDVARCEKEKERGDLFGGI